VRGIMIIGSPGEERTRRLDARRVEDLGRMARSIEIYYMRHQRLPASIEELSKEPGLAGIPRDPETGAAYPYRSLDADGYELCATFAREAGGVRPADVWSHGAGMQCFTLKANPATRIGEGSDRSRYAPRLGTSRAASTARSKISPDPELSAT
jgi:hypothetical protein